MIGRLFGIALTGIIGVVFVTVGYLIWKKEKLSLLHSYHTDKVTAEDRAVFCTCSGLGVILIGIGLLVTAVMLGVTDSALSFLAFAVGMIAGLSLLCYAGWKYNR